MKFSCSLAVCAFAAAAVLPLLAEEEPSPSPSPSSSAITGDKPKADFGDFSSSALTGKAWKASESGDAEMVKTYTKKCIEMFEANALEMQAAIKEPVDTKDKEKVFANWALNDVGTCYFILGQTLEKGGDKAGALDAYKKLSEKFPDAECWDPKGWFWKPADAAKGKLKALEFDSVS